MYLPAEFLDRDACALNREFMAFNLKEEEGDCTRQCEFAKKSRTVSKSDPLAEEKILFQHHTVLNKHMVSVKRSQHNLSRSLSKMLQLFSEYIFMYQLL